MPDLVTGPDGRPRRLVRPPNLAPGDPTGECGASLVWPASVHAPSTATLPTARPVFVSLHLGVILLLGGLSYLPMLVLGVIDESFTT